MLSFLSLWIVPDREGWSIFADAETPIGNRGYPDKFRPTTVTCQSPDFAQALEFNGKPTDGASPVLA